MKVFVPMPDAALGANNELYGKLVPFNPGFVVAHGSRGEGSERGRKPGLEPRKGRKPKNWISTYDADQARARLSIASRREIAAEA